MISIGCDWDWSVAVCVAGAEPGAADCLFAWCARRLEACAGTDRSRTVLQLANNNVNASNARALGH